MKALVIEDTKIYQQLLDAVLEDLGMSTVFVDTAQEGLELLEQQSDFELICLDYHLPDMNGLDLSRILRNLQATRLTSIVLLTANQDPTLFKEAFEAGITEVLFKGSVEDLHRSFQDFVTRLRRVLSGRVLYVEDSPTTAQLTIHLLQKMELEVTHYQSAEEAFSEFQQNDYDLVVTDIVVEGGMSGVGLVRNIRSLETDKREVPILAVSSLEDLAQRIEILALGANDYVAKPIVEQEFSARVGNLIQTKQLFDQVKEQQVELRTLAVTDQLTSLYNRHYLFETAHKFVSNAERHTETLSLLIVDLDHFKAINDGYGHDVGDHVLKSVGELLKSMSRDGDVAARFGGEEFVILLVQCDSQNAERKAEDIRARIEELNPQGIRVTASIGVTTLVPSAGWRFDDLFKQADKAVYRAKAAGRNRIETHKQDSQQSPHSKTA